MMKQDQSGVTIMRPSADAPRSAGAIASVAVFCGSRLGADPAYAAAARAAGAGLAQAGIRLIYGGGKIGLMGLLADAAIAAGGVVSGVIPDFLSTREVMHEQVADLTVTDSMHSRKQRMFAEADAFLVLPGGLGTFDETMEIITWRQLRLHDKPIVIANVAGWAEALLAALDRAVEDGFADASARALFSVAPSVEAALARFAEQGSDAGRTANLSKL